MKVLLVNPYSVSAHIHPPLGLGYLASAIRPDHDVEILDCIKDKIGPHALIKAVERAKPDVVGIQCYSTDIFRIKFILQTLKSYSVKTVLGGPHPSAVPRETMEFFGESLDYLFHGEAEVGFKRLLDKLGGWSGEDYEAIPGLAWRKSGKVIVNEKSLVEDIDSLGTPAWDLIKPHEYPESQHGAFFKKFPIAPIITTRGCPYSCTFCAGNLISGKRLRKRSVRSILSEIKMLYDKFGIREIHIVDDNFTMDRGFATEFLINLKKMNLDISWAVPNGVRIDALNDEMLDLMKETGLYLLSMGIESGSDRILRLMKKGTTVDKIRRSVAMIRKHKIDIAGFFIIGFPGATIEEIRKTIRFSLELDLLRANFFTYLPFPGTESYNELKRTGKLDDIR